MQRFVNSAAAALIALSLAGAVRASEQVSPPTPPVPMKPVVVPQSLVGTWKLTVTDANENKQSCQLVLNSDRRCSAAGDFRFAGGLFDYAPQFGHVTIYASVSDSTPFLDLYGRWVSDGVYRSVKGGYLYTLEWIN